MDSVTQVKLRDETARRAEALGFNPIAYLTHVRRGVYDATLVYAGTQRVQLVCEGYSRKACLERVGIYLAHRAPGV